MDGRRWAWQDDAACRGEDLVLFFGPAGERQPERDVRERSAKAICAQCPARNPCLMYALSVPEKYGTWGGLTEDERASERRRRMRRAGMAGLAAHPPEIVEEATKYCGGCRTVLPVSSFSRDVTKRDGLHSWCRACANEARRQREAAERAVAS